ncbi:MAG: hypothetical protein HY401_08245 [Elusimicrobia bacterium]|nr:hypothetical protein [Elusimicrobiota bacterium]
MKKILTAAKLSVLFSITFLAQINLIQAGDKENKKEGRKLLTSANGVLGMTHIQNRIISPNGGIGLSVGSTLDSKGKAGSVGASLSFVYSNFDRNLRFQPEPGWSISPWGENKRTRDEFDGEVRTVTEEYIYGGEGIRSHEVGSVYYQTRRFNRFAFKAAGGLTRYSYDTTYSMSRDVTKSLYRERCTPCEVGRAHETWNSATGSIVEGWGKVAIVGIDVLLARSGRDAQGSSWPGANLAIEVTKNFYKDPSLKGPNYGARLNISVGKNN